MKERTHIPLLWLLHRGMTAHITALMYYSPPHTLSGWKQNSYRTWMSGKRVLYPLKEYQQHKNVKCVLSQETMLGLQITSIWYSFSHAYNCQLHVHFSLQCSKTFKLTYFLFSQRGTKTFLSRKICQDPLEAFFGCQHQRGRTHNNPTAQENSQAIRVMRMTPSTSNCREQDVTPPNYSSYTPLPKEPRIANKAEE